ncbi:MAG: sugar phosphate isomerase/epimerase family protein, partial [Rhizomicrobium sp.]
SYPFRAYMAGPHSQGPGKIKLDDFAAMAIKRFGIYNINPVVYNFESTDHAYLEKLRKSIADAGSHLVGLGLSGAQFWDPDPARVEAAVNYGKKWIDIAIVLGSPSVRQHLQGSHGVAPDANRAARSLGRLAEYGARKNVVINLENDDVVNENPFFIVKVIEMVRNPYLHALPDFGNTIRLHGAAYNQRGLTQMFKHALNMSHVKAEVVGHDGTVYKVDVGKIYGIAKASGYRGYFSMECESGRQGPFVGTERLVKESLKYLA